MNSEYKTGYGLGVKNPVCCGGGLDHGASNEIKYLKRLRCPNGDPVRYQRQGSTMPLFVTFMEGGLNTMSKEQIAEMAMSGGIQCIDIYTVHCTCLQHRATVYMNFYKEGPDKPIELPGWFLVEE